MNQAQENNIGLVVLNYNDAVTTKSFVEAVKEYGIIGHIAIVDNCSKDDSFNQLKVLENNKIDVIRTDHNGGYGFGNNYGVNYLVDKYKCKYIIISNPDVEVSQESIAACLKVFKNNHLCGVVAPMMKMPSGKTNYYCAWKVPSFFEYVFFGLACFRKIARAMYYSIKELSQPGYMKVGCVAGSFLLVDADKFIQCGCYDENIFLYCEETALGIRLNKCGYESALLRDTYFVHHHSVSINKSYKDILARYRLMWDSREYVLNTYYKKNLLRSVMIKTCRFLSLAERWIVKDR